MSEGHPSLPDREDDRTEYVQRFEDMLSRNDHYFFDVEEFELIIEHYLDNNDLKKARQVLDYARQQHPGSVDLLFCEAQVLMGLGKLNGALDVLDSIQKLEPFNEDVHLHKASIHSQLRNYRKAIEHYRKALELADEGLDDIYLDLAFEHENCEQFDEAIVCLKKALDVNPENEAVLYELAYCFDLAEAHEASVVFFRNFTNEHPYSFVSWYNLGNALAKLNRLEESNQALELCLAIEEEFSSAYFSKARNLLQSGDFEAAIACYQETLNIDGPQAVTFSYIGECYEKMERYEQALIHYDQALALDPNWVDAWIGRGVVRDFQGKLPEAIKDLENAVRIAPDSGDGWFYLGNVLARAERFPEAVEAYEKLNGMEPESLDGWLDHADLMLHLKGPEAALRKLRDGELVHKLNSRFKYRMVSYLLRAGKEQAALLDLEEALMADHSGHTQLLEHYPEASAMPQVMHLIELYKR